jgi:hypothetical protein
MLRYHYAGQFMGSILNYVFETSVLCQTNGVFCRVHASNEEVCQMERFANTIAVNLANASFTNTSSGIDVGPGSILLFNNFFFACRLGGCNHFGFGAKSGT